MAGITLAQAEEILGSLIAAAASSTNIVTASVSGQVVTYQGLDAINKAIIFWDGQVKRLSRSGIRVRGVDYI